MATLPSSEVRVSETAGAPASGDDLICVIAPVATNADGIPRLFGNAAEIFTNHGYSEGLEYSALHIAKCRKAVMFCGIPIATAGTVGRFNSSGNTGSCVVTAAAGGSGCFTEHDGEVKVVDGGTVGTDQIRITVSLDGGRLRKTVRLGTANSYVIPYVGVTLSFAAGTLVAGDTVLTWHGTAPLSDASGWSTARTKLGEQDKLFRSALLCGDLSTHTEALAFSGQWDTYETSNERSVNSRASIADRMPYAAMSQIVARMTGNPNLTFAEVGATGDTITRSAGSWITDGFAVGDYITVTGSVSNNVSGPIASLSATVITLGTTDLAAEGPVGNVTVVGCPTITFAEVGATGDTITRSRGSWLDDGFRVGDKITVAGTASNNFTAAAGLATVTATVLTLGSDDLVAEELKASAITLTAGQTKAVWMAAADAEFASVDNAPHINLAAGRGRIASPFSDWNFRRSAAWAASLREFSNDIHIATWRKSDKATGFDLFDTDNTLVEWDDFTDGNAGTRARFTTFRRYSNSNGAFIAQDLTRNGDGTLRSQQHNAAVVNAVCNTVQLATENACIGRSLVLNADGTATTDELGAVQKEVNDQLELTIASRGQGPRASSAVWTPNPNDILDVAEPLMTGVVALLLNGTVHSVATTVRIRSGGQ